MIKAATLLATACVMRKNPLVKRAMAMAIIKKAAPSMMDNAWNAGKDFAGTTPGQAAIGAGIGGIGTYIGSKLMGRKNKALPDAAIGALLGGSVGAMPGLYNTMRTDTPPGEKEQKQQQIAELAKKVQEQNQGVTGAVRSGTKDILTPSNIARGAGGFAAAGAVGAGGAAIANRHSAPTRVINQLTSSAGDAAKGINSELDTRRQRILNDISTREGISIEEARATMRPEELSRMAMSGMSLDQQTAAVAQDPVMRQIVENNARCGFRGGKRFGFGNSGVNRITEGNPELRKNIFDTASKAQKGVFETGPEGKGSAGFMGRKPGYWKGVGTLGAVANIGQFALPALSKWLGGGDTQDQLNKAMEDYNKMNQTAATTTSSAPGTP